MRTIIVILIIAVVALIAAIQAGFVDIDQTRAGQLPNVEADGGKVTTSGGQAPAFDIATGSVGVGSTDANVAVPTVRIEPGRKTVTVPAIEIRKPGDNKAEPAPAGGQ